MKEWVFGGRWAPLGGWRAVWRVWRRGLAGGGLAVALAAGGGCAYKIEIKQGNEGVLANADRLEVGMSREEVEALLGPAPAQRLFKKNRWIYAFQLREAGFEGRTRLISLEVVFDEAETLVEVNTLRDDYAEGGSG